MRWARYISTIGAVALSAILLILSFPAFELHFLAWIALLPLLFLIKRGGYARAFFAALAVGFVMYSGLLWWTLKLSNINAINFSLSMLYTSCYVGLFALAAHFFRNHMPRSNVLTFPTTWVVLEYIRSHAGFLSLPWGILGYSQYTVLPVASLSAWTGVYGVSFLIVAVNTALAELISLTFAAIYDRTPQDINIDLKPRLTVGVLTGVLLLLPVCLLAGLLRTLPAAPTNTLTVALAQGNVYWDETRFASYRDYAKTIFQAYADLTLRVTEADPDLIAWPASSVPGRLPLDRVLYRMLSRLAQKTNAFLLVGSSGYDKFASDRGKRTRVANSAFLFTPQGKIVGRYDKIRLLPFDEYLPLRNYVAWPSWIVDKDMNDFIPGKKLTIFDMDKGKFGLLICWENLFPDLFRRMAAKGVDFMVSMTNEAFTDVPAAHYQMLAMNVFRAIENHVAIVRTAPTGVSALIGPGGHIVRVQNHDADDVNIAGHLIAQLPLSSARTMYTRYGDWFVYTLFVMLIGCTALGWRHRIHQRQMLARHG